MKVGGSSIRGLEHSNYFTLDPADLETLLSAFDQEDEFSY